MDYKRIKIEVNYFYITFIVDRKLYKITMCVKIDGTVKNLLFLVSDFREIILSNFSTSKIVIIGTVIWGIFQDDKLYFNLHLSF